MNAEKKALLDDLADMMNSRVESVPEGEERDEIVNRCLEVLLMFGFISAYVAGIDEDTMHDLVHQTYTDLRESKNNNAN